MSNIEINSILDRYFDIIVKIKIDCVRTCLHFFLLIFGNGSFFGHFDCKRNPRNDEYHQINETIFKWGYNRWLCPICQQQTKWIWIWAVVLPYMSQMKWSIAYPWSRMLILWSLIQVSFNWRIKMHRNVNDVSSTDSIEMEFDGVLITLSIIINYNKWNERKKIGCNNI